MEDEPRYCQPSFPGRTLPPPQLSIRPRLHHATDARHMIGLDSVDAINHPLPHEIQYFNKQGRRTHPKNGARDWRRTSVPRYIHQPEPILTLLHGTTTSEAKRSRSSDDGFDDEDDTDRKQHKRDCSLPIGKTGPAAGHAKQEEKRREVLGGYLQLFERILYRQGFHEMEHKAQGSFNMWRSGLLLQKPSILKGTTALLSVALQDEHIFGLSSEQMRGLSRHTMDVHALAEIEFVAEKKSDELRARLHEPIDYLDKADSRAHAIMRLNRIEACVRENNDEATEATLAFIKARRELLMKELSQA